MMSGAQIVAADGAGNGSEPSDAFMRAMLDAAAQYERALIRARTKAALAAKAAKQECVGAIPYGWRLGADGVRLEQDAAEQAAVAIMGELRGAGLSYDKITAQLNEGKVRPRSGRRWHATQVQRALGRVVPGGRR